ncbi:MAG: hypothetical protein KDK75_22735, partial [Alphaproteobacteria bacterium]|nr:hypothetical protein [Alphaproteobacteria bacterium]
PQPKISVVAERPKKVEVPKGAKLIIRRTSEAAATVEAAPETMIAEPPATSAPELAPQTPAPPEAEATAAPEAVVSETPKVESETAAAPKSEALPQAEGSPKRRIVIIRHKPGEEIDVPLQNDMAEAS